MNKGKKRKYSQKEMDFIADTLTSFIELRDQFCIKEGLDQKEYENAIKVVKKCIKNCRKGKGDEVFNAERYDELMKKYEGE